MEKFKSKTGEPVRLASTTGHVTIVGGKFKEVPPALEDKAMAAGLVPKSLYDEVKADVETELRGNMSLGDEGAGKDEKPAPAEDKNAQILAALTRVSKEAEAGKTETEKGNKLLHNGKPVLAAVSEYAGIIVNTADIEEALK